nr:hypothetical protein [uncultured Desulfobacter sp.]
MVKFVSQYFLIGFVLFFLSSYAFGGAWLPTEIATDSDGDGTIDAIAYSDYDTDGNCTETRVDDGVDGIMESALYYSYSIVNEYDYDIVIKFDQDFDGIMDSISYFSYKNNGKLSITEIDSDADDAIETFSYSTCDDANFPTICNHYTGTGAYDSIGTLASITYYTYDADCNLVLKENDSDADGQIDEITKNTYNEQCRLSVVKIDADNDGEFESVTQHSYDDGGLVCRTEAVGENETYGMFYSYNLISDFTNTYDENGYVTKIETHTYGTQTYEYLGSQVVDDVDFYSVESTTYEYFENAQGPEGSPYASECGCPSGEETLDVEGLASVFGSQEGNAGYDQSYDMDQDGDIDGVDIFKKL